MRPVGGEIVVPWRLAPFVLLCSFKLPNHQSESSLQFEHEIQQGEHPRRSGIDFDPGPWVCNLDVPFPGTTEIAVWLQHNHIAISGRISEARVAIQLQAPFIFSSSLAGSETGRFDDGNGRLWRSIRVLHCPRKRREGRPDECAGNAEFQLRS